jgi:hypothetical protein
MGSRRKHHKIAKLPDEVTEAVNKQLVEGYTYQQISDWLSQMGHQVGKSSVGRYGKDFLSKLEKLKLVKDQAKAIIETNPDAPTTELAEAANQLALSLITDTLMSTQDLEGAKITEVLKALSLLERSGVAREKLKLEYKTKVQQVVDKIEQTGKQKGLDPETLSYIKEQVYGIV